MQTSGTYWECSRCGALNKAYAALCFTCGGDTRKAARDLRRSEPDRFLTRGARLLFAAALVLSALVGFALVRTFRTPALEQAAAAEPDADVGREPVPPEATMPGAPDSGWPAAAASPAPASAEPDRAVVTLPAVPARPEPARSYTDADLRTFVARRGVAAAMRDAGYLLALRQRRVDDLRQRLAEAGSADEREKLRGWLDDAQADLERARR
jgi:hypothetical protein